MFGISSFRTHLSLILKTTRLPPCLATPRIFLCFVLFCQEMCQPMKVLLRPFLRENSHSEHPESSFPSTLSWKRFKQAITFHLKSDSALPLECEVKPKACQLESVMFIQRCEQQRAQRVCWRNSKILWVISLAKLPRNEEVGKPVPTKQSLPVPPKRKQLGLSSLWRHYLEKIFLIRKWLGLLFSFSNCFWR